MCLSSVSSRKFFFRASWLVLISFSSFSSFSKVAYKKRKKENSLNAFKTVHSLSTLKILLFTLWCKAEFSEVITPVFSITRAKSLGISLAVILSGSIARYAVLPPYICFLYIYIYTYYGWHGTLMSRFDMISVWPLYKSGWYTLCYHYYLILFNIQYTCTKCKTRRE